MAATTVPPLAHHARSASTSASERHRATGVPKIASAAMPDKRIPSARFALGSRTARGSAGACRKAAIPARTAATGAAHGAVPTASGPSISRCRNVSCTDSSITSSSWPEGSPRTSRAPAAASAHAAAAPWAWPQRLYSSGIVAAAAAAERPFSTRAATSGRVRRTATRRRCRPSRSRRTMSSPSIGTTVAREAAAQEVALRLRRGEACRRPGVRRTGVPCRREIRHRHFAGLGIGRVEERVARELRDHPRGRLVLEFQHRREQRAQLIVARERRPGRR